MGLVLWNSAGDVEGCLDALAAQTAAGDIDLVVVDNASTDGGAELARALWPAARLIRNSRNLGFAAAQNQAIRAAPAPFFLALNPDVRLGPAHIELLRGALRDDPRAGSAGGVLLRSDGRIDTAGLLAVHRKRLFVDIEEEPAGEEPREVLGVCAAAALYRREALAAAALVGEVFDEDLFAYLEDVDLALRLRRAGWTSLVVPRARGRHERGSTRPERWEDVLGMSLRNRYLVLVKHEGLLSLLLSPVPARDAARLVRIALQSPRALRRLADLPALIPRAFSRRRGILPPLLPGLPGVASAKPPPAAPLAPAPDPGLPELSAIIVTHESPAQEVLAAHRSLATAFAGRRVETIVVDNGSREPCFPPGAMALRNERNRGFAAACNRGVAAARAPVLLFLNPDARLGEGRWGDLLDRFRTEPRLGALGPLRRDPSTARAMGIPPAVTPEQLFRDLIAAGRDPATPPEEEPPDSQEAEWLPASCLLVSAEVFAEVGGFDESFFLYFEDVDLCRRIRETGRRVVFTPAAEVLHRESGHGKYHDRRRLACYFLGLARYLERWHPSASSLVPWLLLARILSRGIYWTGARALGRIDGRAWRERVAGYAAAIPAVFAAAGGGKGAP